MTMKKILLVVLSMFIFSGLLLADVKFPSPSGLVNDYAGVLSSSQKQEIEGITTALEKNTGAELAVVIVKTVAPLDSKLYAVKLFEKWGIGKKGVDNGVLLLLAMEERRVEIEVGYGLEGVLTDSICGKILDNFAVPNFKKGDVGEGMLQTAQALSKVIAKEEITFPASSDDDDFPWITIVIVGVFVFFVLMVIIFGKNGGTGSGGSSSRSGGWSSSNSSSSSSSSSFGGGSSGGGGSGRSW
jgi:uncharacterized protein